MIRGATRTVRLGVKSLMLHKLRAALTMLGVLFGVSSVVASEKHKATEFTP